MNLSDSESEVSDWNDAAASRRSRGRRGRGRGKGRGGLPGGPLLPDVPPGGFGLLPEDRQRQLSEQHQLMENGAAGAGGNVRRRERETYPKIVSRRAGFRQVNTCCINLSNIKVGQRQTLPSDVEVNLFLLKKCGLTPDKLTRVCAMRNRQEFWVSFTTEAEADSFEKKLLAGIDWGDGRRVTGHRMDVPSLAIKVRGAAEDITEETVRTVLAEFGEVKSCVRGTAPMSGKSKEGDLGWVWDGVWHVALKANDDAIVPSYILADEDHWQLEFPGSKRLCWHCLRDGHPHWRCPARERLPEDGPIGLIPELGDQVYGLDIVRNDDEANTLKQRDDGTSKEKDKGKNVNALNNAAAVSLPKGPKGHKRKGREKSGPGDNSGSASDSESNRSPPGKKQGGLGMSVPHEGDEGGKGDLTLSVSPVTPPGIVESSNSQEARIHGVPVSDGAFAEPEEMDSNPVLEEDSMNNEAGAEHGAPSDAQDGVEQVPPAQETQDMFVGGSSSTHVEDFSLDSPGLSPSLLEEEGDPNPSGVWET